MRGISEDIYQKQLKALAGLLSRTDSKKFDDLKKEVLRQVEIVQKTHHTSDYIRG